MNYISSDIIINNVKTELESYDLAGSLSEDDFYRWIQYLLNKLGISTSIEAERILDIKDYKAIVPDDFHILWSAHLCEECNSKGIKREFYSNPAVYYIRDEFKNICYDDSRCERDRTITGTEIKQEIGFYYTDYEVSYCNRDLLTLKKGHNYCHQSCPNLRHKSCNEFTINDNYFNFNVEKGSLHLQYYAIPKDEEGYPIILNDENIKQALEDYLIYRSFKKLYFNNIGDVLQRMQYAELKHQQSLKEVYVHLLTPTFKDLVDFSKKLASNLEVFNLNSLANGVYSTSKRFKSRY